ncbi:hypothetical protein CR513_38129 [Mucuna pruriens]|uniref:Uncharacterized protein n=1 Tax=Mucuna pruriens TaxID=157652 RepID=A0A371FSA2_MUCPR|nr:hypothetical protein CR513_38129 [Mucuna pruriens]
MVPYWSHLQYLEISSHKITILLMLFVLIYGVQVILVILFVLCVVIMLKNISQLNLILICLLVFIPQNKMVLLNVNTIILWKLCILSSEVLMLL